MFADQNFRNIHHQQHQDQVDSETLKPLHRLSPTHAYSMFQSAFAFVEFTDEKKLHEPHLERFPEKNKKVIVKCHRLIMQFYYHKNRREAKENDRFDGDRIVLPFKSDLSVAAEKATLHIAHRKLDEYENSCSW
jgi:hypothetical protein